MIDSKHRLILCKPVPEAEVLAHYPEQWSLLTLGLYIVSKFRMP